MTLGPHHARKLPVRTDIETERVALPDVEVKAPSALAERFYVQLFSALRRPAAKHRFRQPSGF